MESYWRKCLALYRSGRPLVFYDTETTGLINPGQPLPFIWELAGIKRDADGTYSGGAAILKIGVPVPAEADLRHRDANALILTGHPPVTVLSRFARFIAGAVLVGHNIDRFDSILLAEAYRRVGLPVPLEVTDHAHSLDTLRLAWELFPPRGEPGSPANGFGLGKLAAWLGIKVEETDLHGAEADARLCEKLLSVLIPAAEAVERNAARAKDTEK
jgi:DNA polymerase III alpha subunit (gram-positive type)